MEFVLQFFFLLCVFSFLSQGKAYTLPYDPNGGECRNTFSEYISTDSSLCCSKCRPGFRLLTACTASSDTVCEECKGKTYSDTMNYYHNCFSCNQCNPSKHLVYTKPCTTESNSHCECETGWYCSSRMRDETCTHCKKLATCPPGKGAKSPGSPTTKCIDCAEGTFSNETSSRACQPHTQCEAEGREVLHRGNATHDTVCKTLIPPTTTPTRPPTTTRPPPTTTTTTAQTTTLCDTAPPTRAVVHPTTVPNITPKDARSLPPENNIVLYSIIGIVAVVILLVVLLTLIIICHKKGLRKPPVKEVIQNGKALDSKMESELLLEDGKTSSSSSASSTPDNQSQSTGDSQDNIHSEQTSVSSPCVNFSFTATINCQLNQTQGSCCIPIQPQPPPYPQPQPQPEPETETHPPPVQPDLPLSQEEQLLRVSCEEENRKDALQSVQESGMTVF